ncbi:DUF5133 domain-containing protein [Streptomyces johnsoniae]|uniref:DUF5133 domain-containing protein n=1 Tax=Streptomyces johnsoniae TaxID=3075532 RepID=A0ABU2S232_9ACTN|nr:DUF5133 domain-containing protein [Streptomyces sp. DSM 41886]MDT0443064.1 DUF5133 domain-containing protein [Streptomyces sp. DSM 41886]
MLMAHPDVLRTLIDQYETLGLLHTEGADDPEVRQRREDVAYTLCVATGTRDVDAALAAARRQLNGVGAFLDQPARRGPGRGPG